MEQSPFMVGVTGHRDLVAADEAALAGKVRDILAGFGKPVMLISALAEGADRLAARVALEAGFPLFAVLPMPKKLYEEDFRTATSKAAFHQLWEKATRRIELPLRSGALERSNQYQDAGTFIVGESRALIALWDGVDTRKRGGTSEVVKLATGRIPIYRIPARRASN